MRYLLKKVGTIKNNKPKKDNYTEQEKIEIRKKRYEVMRCHGFRQFFNTICIESDMNIVSKELLMGHKQSLGLEKSYYRPTNDKLLNEDLKVVEDLTINDEYRLSKQVQELKTKNEDSEYVIKGKLQEMNEKNREKDFQIKYLMDQVETLINENNNTKQQFIDIADKIETITKKTNSEWKQASSREERFNIFLQGREEKYEQQQRLEQQLKKLRFKTLNLFYNFIILYI